jgi:hypothetical protein
VGNVFLLPAVEGGASIESRERANGLVPDFFAAHEARPTFAIYATFHLRILGFSARLKALPCR